MKNFLFIMAVAIMAATTSCGTSSDETTEKKLEATWVSTETETEDGVRMTYMETMALDASTHEFEQELTVSGYAYGESVNICKLTVTGKWSASKDEIEFDFSEEDIDINNIDKDFLSEIGGKKSVIDAIMESKGAFKIEKITNNTLILKDDDGEKTEYTKQ